MRNSLICYIEEIAERFPDKVAFTDDNGSMTFSALRERSMDVGAALSCHARPGEPVLIISGKSITTITYMIGILYAGCYYINLESELPMERLGNIISRVDAGTMLTDDGGAIIAENVGYCGRVLNMTAPSPRKSDPDGWRSTVDTDPLYILFTSGSTGVPKGVVTPHRAVMDYIEAFASAAGISHEDVLGNQAPLDYVAAIRDVYLPLFTGASTVLLPKKLFSMPNSLFAAIAAHGITTLCWVVSAFAIPVKLNAFATEKAPSCIKKVIFTGSVMPPSVIRQWQKALPGAMFMNHYGPTEITASCTYHIVDHIIEDGEEIPIGVPFNNAGMLILKDGQVLPRDAFGPENTGELCVKGSGLALGYFRDEEKTRASFVQNPDNGAYPETIYRTGDLGYFDENGVLHFRGRMDRQIKMMGHRIELDEIEAVAMTAAGMASCSCQFDISKEILYLFYTGSVEKRTVALTLRKSLPDFMIPRRLVPLPELPKLPNGKTDTVSLKKLFK